MKNWVASEQHVNSEMNIWVISDNDTKLMIRIRILVWLIDRAFWTRIRFELINMVFKTDYPELVERTHVA